MAKGSAKEHTMGNLHDRIARVFEKVLATYEKRLDAVDGLDATVTADLGEDMLSLLMGDNIMPNPAMLAAVTKFLKDNDISYDTEEVEKLSATEERLAARRAKRTNLSSLTKLALVENG